MRKLICYVCFYFIFSTGKNFENIFFTVYKFTLFDIYRYKFSCKKWLIRTCIHFHTPICTRSNIPTTHTHPCTEEKIHSLYMHNVARTESLGSIQLCVRVCVCLYWLWLSNWLSSNITPPLLPSTLNVYVVHTAYNLQLFPQHFTKTSVQNYI